MYKIDRGRLTAKPEHSTFEERGSDGEMVEWQMFDFRYEPENRADVEAQVPFIEEHISSDYWNHLEVGSVYDFHLRLALTGDLVTRYGSFKTTPLLVDVTTPHEGFSPA